MIAEVEFISASTAGIVHVELGFKPDMWMLIANHGGTNPNILFGVNGGAGADFPSWPAALSLLITGSTGVITRDTTGMTVYNGAETIVTAETANSDPKHINRAGAPAGAGHVTAHGVSIPADHQVNSGRNLLVAFRNDL